MAFDDARKQLIGGSTRLCEGAEGDHRGLSENRTLVLETLSYRHGHL